MKIMLFTNCSISKVHQAILTMDQLGENLGLQEALQKWVALNRAVPVASKVTPREQYRGIAFSSLQSLEKYIPLEDMYVVTGGQGLMNLVHDLLIPYDFTGDFNADDNIKKYITKDPFVHSVWWAGINKELRGSETPIADKVMKSDHDIIFVACTKVFLKYIASDILSIPPERRKDVYVLISQSNVGNVTTLLRPNMVPFGREFANTIPGNRNNAVQRVLEVILNSAEWNSTRLFEIINDMRTSNNKVSEVQHGVSIQKILEEHPSLLSMDCDTAYAKARRTYGNFGGRANFRAAFTRAKGVSVSDAAMQALDVVEPGGSAHVYSNAAVTDIIITFVEALRKRGTATVFTADTVLAWIEKYFEIQSKPVPEELESVQKISSLLSAASEGLGLKRIKTSGKVSYAIGSEFDDEDDLIVGESEESEETEES